MLKISSSGERQAFALRCGMSSTTESYRAKLSRRANCITFDILNTVLIFLFWLGYFRQKVNHGGCICYICIAPPSSCLLGSIIRNFVFFFSLSLFQGCVFKFSSVAAHFKADSGDFLVIRDAFLEGSSGMEMRPGRFDEAEESEKILTNLDNFRRQKKVLHALNFERVPLGDQQKPVRNFSTWKADFSDDFCG